MLELRLRIKDTLQSSFIDSECSRVPNFSLCLSVTKVQCLISIGNMRIKKYERVSS